MTYTVRRGSRMHSLLRLLAIPAAAAALGCQHMPMDQEAQKLTPLQGSRLGDPVAGLNSDETARFERGREVFARVFAPEEGLGPLFNANSCGECHEDPLLGGVGDEIELQATFPGVLNTPAVWQPTDSRHKGLAPTSAGCDLLVDYGGPVYQLEVTPALGEALGIDREPLPSMAVPGARTTPDLFGFGLLDAVPDEVLLALADPDDLDGDGISGRVNLFDDGRIGRFGRKAFTPTLAEFNAEAFHNEMGITTFAAMHEGSVGGQPFPAGVDPVSEPELSDEDVRLASDFVRFLAPPRAKGRGLGIDSGLGENLFAQVGCAACHVPVLQTGPSDVEALAFQEVAAYTDLLLHDMGPELADICTGLATPSEFRTEPLMGLRLSEIFMHDGRASSIEAAILLHGGEAARSRQAFLDLNEGHRRVLLVFLRDL